MTNDSPGTGRDLVQGAIHRATAGAGAVMKANFVHDDWVMSADGFEAYWKEERLAGFCTVSPQGRPHVVAIEPALIDGNLVMNTFANAVRVVDLRRNPNAALISWGSPWEVVVIYGKATLSEEARDGMLTVTLVLDRIYCIRPPSWHHASR